MKRICEDAGLCRDCQICTLACSLYHEGRCSPRLARLSITKDMARFEFNITVCRHCESPGCAQACPSGALEQAESGIVVVREELCIQCGACVAGCAYGAIFHDEASDRYLKCDLCGGRAGGPLCVERCPTGALSLSPDTEK